MRSNTTNPETLAFARQQRRQMTEAEIALWSHLRRKQCGGFKFRRQVPIGSYVVDFACLSARIIVELDGSQHAEDEKYDNDRSTYLEARGFRVLRFWNNELFTQRQKVLDTIWHAAAGRRE